MRGGRALHQLSLSNLNGEDGCAGITLCLFHSSCRLIQAVTSDTTQWGLGRIYRPTRQVAGWQGIGTDTINNNNTHFRITSSTTQYLFVGATVERVGSVNGWDWTYITATCVNLTLSTGVVITCMNRTEHGMNNGDSGASVFQIISPINDVPAQVTYLGLHVGTDGGEGYYSPLTQIENDYFTDLKVCYNLTC